MSDRSQEIKTEIHSLIKEFYELNHKNKKSEVKAVSGKLFDETELQYITESALDGWFTTGRFNKEFENKLKDFIGVKHLMTVNSGSSANLVASATLFAPELKERAMKPGDEFISVAASFPTTVSPLIALGAKPVFVDIDIPSYNLDPQYLEQALSEKTKAIMIAHTLGNPFDLEKISNFCKKHNLWLIEDCCDALGATYMDQHVGTYGDIGTLSFYPAHHITTGEGGAVFMNNPTLKKIAESYRDWGRDCWCPPGVDNTCGIRFDWQLGDLPKGYDHKYIYSRLGFNLKISDMQAALGLAQTEKLESFIEARKSNFNRLKSKLEGLEDKLILPEASPNADPSWFGFLLSVNPENCSISRNDLTRELNERKIGTRLLFAGDIRKQPFFKDIEYREVGDLKNTEFIMNNTFWVGVAPLLSEEDIDYIADNIRELVS